MTPLGRFLLQPQIERFLRIKPESKPEVYLTVFDGADVENLNYWIELVLSAAIATFGLILNSPAVVIGAMLVSPLMGPIIASGLALAAADVYLGIKSLAQLALSTVAAILVGAFITWVLPFDTPTSEVLARTRPNLLDLGVALSSGLAGSLLVCRSRSPEGGGVSALPGVAIAVALMPPLCSVGFGVGVGFALPIVTGAGLLFLTNLAAIIAAAFLVFLAIGMSSDDVRLGIAAGLMERAGKDPVYKMIERRTGISRALSKVGELRWRVLMLLVTLGILFVPLTVALSQLRLEAIAREAISQAVQMITPREGIITQNTSIPAEPNPIVVRLIVADPVEDQKVEEAERHIMRLTGREVRLRVRRVANEEELVNLREGLAGQAETAAMQDLQAIHADVLARIERPLKDLWPESQASLDQFELGFRPSGILLRVAYSSENKLDAAVEQVLAKALGDRLGIPNLRLLLEQQEPAPAE
jgi:uncharacterized hydrophobic protein (TIGR00271 family)